MHLTSTTEAQSRASPRALFGITGCAEPCDPKPRCAFCSSPYLLAAKNFFAHAVLRKTQNVARHDKHTTKFRTKPLNTELLPAAIVSRKS